MSAARIALRVPKQTEHKAVYALVRKFFGFEWKARAWMKTKNPLLGGMSPRDLIKIHPGKVLKFVLQQLAENAPRGENEET